MINLRLSCANNHAQMLFASAPFCFITAEKINRNGFDLLIAETWKALLITFNTQNEFLLKMF